MPGSYGSEPGGAALQLATHLGTRSFSAPAGCHHVDIPIPGPCLRRKAVQERGVAIVVKAGIQRNVAKFAELPILRGDIFANAPSNVGWPQLPLNDLQCHGADHIFADLAREGHLGLVEGTFVNRVGLRPERRALCPR
jgi:hypothetical protein